MNKNKFLLGALVTALFGVSGYAWDLRRSLDSRSAQSDIRLAKNPLQRPDHTQIDSLPYPPANATGNTQACGTSERQLTTLIETTVNRAFQQLVDKELATISDRLALLLEQSPSNAEQAHPPAVPEHEKLQIQSIVDQLSMQGSSFNSLGELLKSVTPEGLSPQGEIQLFKAVARLINSGQVQLLDN